MGTEETPVKQEILREPFFKRVGTNIVDWFVKKGQKIKTSFLSYVKSKDVHKLWIKRLIIVAVVILIALSFRVKEYFKLYPFNAQSYLQVSSNRETITSYGGSSSQAIERLETFFENFDSGIEDKIRFELNYSGYKVIEDLSFDGDKLTISIDNRKNKTVPESERTLIVEQYDGWERRVSSNTATYKIVRIVDGVKEEYVLAKQALSSTTSG